MVPNPASTTHGKSGFPTWKVLLNFVIVTIVNSDEDIRLSEMYCKESDLVNPEIYFVRDGKEWVSHSSNIPGRFVIRNVLRQSNGSTSFTKHNVTVSAL
ncbi:hypothetical protein TNCV_5035791 [Trichonephila clavipes]|nr:hypothetical protein TNCV_5035791 [Trichonephila clavipes]